MPMPPARSAPLAVPLPRSTHERLAAAAAARGETVQDIVGGLIERFLATETPPPLDRVLETLKANEGWLKARGVASLWVFGSSARETAAAGSDIDLMAEFQHAANLSLVGIASLQGELADLLGAPVDLIEAGTLHPALRSGAERDRVRVF